MALFKFRPILKIHQPSLFNVCKKNLEIASAELGTSEKFNLEEKVAVITGGASGIGLAIAKEFLQQGINAVSIIDNDREKLDESVAALQHDYGEDRILHTEADVADTEQMDNAFRNTSLHFQSIDLLVNNAGVLDDTNWERQLDINIRGSVIGTLLGMQYMAKSSSGDGGVIVNMGSIMSILPSCGFPIHTMTQFGIAGFTRALGSSRLFDRTGVRVFGFCPGLTDTNYIKDLADKTINHNFASEVEEEMKDCVLQNPVNVARGLLDVIADAKPGSIWICENNTTPYELEFPTAVAKKREEEPGKLGEQTQ